MQGKLALCKSDSQCEKAYDSLTKSAVAALDCVLELKEVNVPAQNISSIVSSNTVECVFIYATTLYASGHQCRAISYSSTQII